MSNARAHVIVSGIVQGVYFRANTREEAKRLSINGWVKNKHDGTVEIVAEGDTERIERLIGWCHKGPPGALVRDVVIEWGEFKGEFKDFGVRY